MAIGNPINLTSNVEGKNISVIATAGQTQFTVTGGYRINQISVFRNGVRLVDGRDFTALDGTIVTLLSAATVADVLEFQVFDDFRVSDALNVNSGGTVNGNVTVTGIVSTANLSIGSSISLDATSGIITAVQVIGGTITGTATTATNAEGLTGTPDITVNNIVAAAATFSGVLTYEDVTNVDSLGIVTARTGVDITANGLVVNAGVSTFGADLSIADKIIHSGDTNTAIRFPSNDKFTVETAGVQRLEVDSNGDLGLVGVATATGLVVVAGSGGYAGHTGIITAVTFDGNLSGNITVSANNTTDETVYPVFVDGTGSKTLETDTSLNYNPSSNNLTAGTFIGAISGSTGSFSGDVDIADKIIHTGDTNTAIRFPAADTFSIETGGSEALRVNSSQRLLINHTTARTDYFQATGLNALINVEGTNNATRATSFVHNSNDAGQHLLVIGKSRGTSVGSNTIVQDDDNMGGISFHGTDGSKLVEGARIEGAVDGTPGSDDMPGRLVFKTTADGAAATTERLRIDSSGRVLIGKTSTSNAHTLQVQASSGALAMSLIGRSADDQSEITFYENDNSTVLAQIQQVSGYSVFRHRTGYLRFDSGGTSEQMRLDSSGRLLINTTTSRIVEDSVGNGPQGLIQIEAADSVAIMSIISAGTNDANRCGTINLGRHRNSNVGATPTIVQSGDALGSIVFSGGDGTDMRTRGATIIAACDGSPAENQMPTRLVIGTNAGSGSVTERLRIDSRGSFQFSNGFMNETVNINTTARTGTQAVNLDDGMVHYFSTNSSGTWKPNFTLSSGNDINATIATGDVFSPTMIVAKGADTHFANSAEVDGTTIASIEFAGGAPTDGGASGTFDVYNYTIIKTGNDAFKAFISVSTYE